MSLLNFEFRNEVLKHNASLSYCYQCSTCSSGCPVALETNGAYNPRKIIQLAILGLEDQLINERDRNVWLCSTCQKCVEMCPQKVELVEIFTLIDGTSRGESVIFSGIKAKVRPSFRRMKTLPVCSACFRTIASFWRASEYV